MTQKTRFVNKRLNSVSWRESSHHAEQITQLSYALEGIGFVGGGAARWLVMGDAAPEPSDIDVFCLRGDTQVAVQNALKALGYRYWMVQGSAVAWTRGFVSLGDGADGRAQDADPAFFEHYTISDVPVRGDDLVVQLVEPRGSLPDGHEEQCRYGAPWEVIADFTFKCEQFAVYAQGATSPLRSVYTYEAMNDTRYKKIHFNKLVSPIYATWRISKYSRKGFKISLAESQALFSAWDALPIDLRGHMLAVDPFGGDVYRELGGLA